MKRGMVAVVALAGALLACRRDDRASVTIATTPEVAGAGIVQMLADRFSAESKAATGTLVTEERLIPDLVRAGVADVVVTTSPKLQEKLQRDGLVRLAQTVAYDDYLLVGPERDPADAGSAKTAAEALRKIARRHQTFCSPADVPGLREREAVLWNASGMAAGRGRRYRMCRGTALDVLNESSRRGAYTLTDRSTFHRAGRRVGLVPLLQGTPLLHNDLVVVLARPRRRHANAEWFVQWLMSYRGRDAIERYRYDDGRRFFVREP